MMNCSLPRPFRSLWSLLLSLLAVTAFLGSISLRAAARAQASERSAAAYAEDEAEGDAVSETWAAGEGHEEEGHEEEGHEEEGHEEEGHEEEGEEEHEEEHEEEGDEEGEDEEDEDEEGEDEEDEDEEDEDEEDEDEEDEDEEDEDEEDEDEEDEDEEDEDEEDEDERKDAHEHHAKSQVKDQAKDGADRGERLAPPAVTHGTALIDGQQIAYTATAGKLLMKTDEGDPKAYVFYVAYTKDDAEPRDRPITFCFNGGPGSCSVWLHLGMLGPHRVKLDSDAGRLMPPAEIIANPHSLLDVTDLVFIDPVSTGYSRPAKGEAKQQFHGYDEDVRSMGQFIHDFTTQHGRWGSPKFLLGESYGGLRAAGLSGQLQQRYRMYLNGIVMVSAVVDFQTLSARGSNDLPYVLFLPSFAATAWYHKALAPEWLDKPVARVVAAAEKFASGPYARALLAGDALPEEQRAEVLARMAELTGLSVEYLDRANLRVSMPQFGKELLRDRREVVGRFDSRYVGFDADPNGQMTEHDPSGSALFGPFTSAMNQYLRDTLQVKEERVYEILTDQVQPWDYSEFVNRYVNASDTLRRAMTDNPYLRVFAACGYYDLATPPYAMQHTMSHLGLPESLRGNVSFGFYEGGHMMYVHEPSLAKLREDLVKFYADALGHE